MKSYSKRELYAAGESLGESVTQRKVGGGYICGGGSGGGGGGPSQQNVTQTNMPEWMRPYAEQMLGSAQKQIYDKDEKGNEIFRKFQAFSKNPSDYFAGPTTAQTKAYDSAMGLGAPAEFDQAKGLASRSGRGSLGAARTAMQYGQGAVNAGADYGRQATNARSQAAYMSPYMQNAVDVQKAQAVRDYQNTIPSASNAATKAGAYGGSRDAIAQAMQKDALGRQLGTIQATGTQSAFEKGQQAQQFATQQALAGYQGGLQGLQGAQAGYAGANTAAQNIAGIGKDKQSAKITAIQMQNQVGKEQQAHQQQIINQQIQDYATAQQYPYLQMSMYNNLIRGLPGQTSTTQMYSAYNPTTQIAGLAGAGFGAAKAFGGAGGGDVRGYAQGGVPDTSQAANAMSGLIPPGKMQSNLQMQSPQYLQMLNSKLPPTSALKQQVGTQLALRERPQIDAAASGVDSLPSGLPEQGMAHGGIMGYAQGGGINALPANLYFADGGIASYAGEDESLVNDVVADPNAPIAVRKNPYEDQLKAAYSTSKGDREKEGWMRFIEGSLNVAAQSGGNTLQNIATGALPALQGYAKDQSAYRKEDRDYLKDMYNISDKQVDNMLKERGLRDTDKYHKDSLTIQKDRNKSLDEQWRSQEKRLADKQVEDKRLEQSAKAFARDPEVIALRRKLDGLTPNTPDYDYHIALLKWKEDHYQQTFGVRDPDGAKVKSGKRPKHEDVVPKDQWATGNIPFYNKGKIKNPITEEWEAPGAAPPVPAAGTAGWGDVRLKGK